MLKPSDSTTTTTKKVRVTAASRPQTSYFYHETRPPQHGDEKRFCRLFNVQPQNND
jgi:hypothetical protein